MGVVTEFAAGGTGPEASVPGGAGEPGARGCQRGHLDSLYQGETIYTFQPGYYLRGRLAYVQIQAIHACCCHVILWLPPPTTSSPSSEVSVYIHATGGLFQGGDLFVNADLFMNASLTVSQRRVGKPPNFTGNSKTGKTRL